MIEHSRLLETELQAELISRFLNQLAGLERTALGSVSSIRINVIDTGGKPLVLIDRPDSELMVFPSTPILHVRAESRAHRHALELCRDPFCQAAAVAGFDWLSFSESDRLSHAFLCKR